MKLLNSIEVRGEQQKRIELYHGDLTYVPENDGVDLLVVSAFTNDYEPTDTSLIGALHRQGVSVGRLARRKEIDLRRDFSCWLSPELSGEFRPEDANVRYRRILCFEPLVRGRPPELVGDIFRALTPILATRPDIKTIAMPIVAAGDQGYTVQEMLTPLLEAGLHWLEAGLPLDRLRIFTHSDVQAKDAERVFSEKKLEYLRSISGPKAQPMDYDVFISYSRANASESEALERALRRAQPSIRLFVDRNDIDIGSAWQPQKFESLDRCRKVVALLSPDYVHSKVCKEEFNIAWIRSREADEDVVFPIYLYTTDLPTYMRYRNYVDCREGDNRNSERHPKGCWPLSNARRSCSARERKAI